MFLKLPTFLALLFAIGSICVTAYLTLYLGQIEIYSEEEAGEVEDESAGEIADEQADEETIEIEEEQ